MQVRSAFVIPYWPSAIFWLSIINEDRSFRSYILDFLMLPKGSEFLYMVLIRIVILVLINLVYCPFLAY